MRYAPLDPLRWGFQISSSSLAAANSLRTPSCCSSFLQPPQEATFLQASRRGALHTTATSTTSTTEQNTVSSMSTTSPSSREAGPRMVLECILPDLLLGPPC